jgi:hypothetical protein
MYKGAQVFPADAACVLTSELACMSQEEQADWLIYVTDEGQAGHFKLVFGAGKKAGIIPAENPPRIDHVGFGLVLGADGKRIRTRDSGAVCTLSSCCACSSCVAPLLFPLLWSIFLAGHE